MDKLLKYNGVQEALKFLREDDERTLQEHLEMCQIPAPSYEEGESGICPKEDGGCRSFRCAR